MSKSVAVIAAAVLFLAFATAGQEAAAQSSAASKTSSGTQAEPEGAERAAPGDLRKKKCPLIIRDPLCDEDDDDVVSPDAAVADEGGGQVPRDPASGLATGKRLHKP